VKAYNVLDSVTLLMSTFTASHIYDTCTLKASKCITWNTVLSHHSLLGSNKINFQSPSKACNYQRILLPPKVARSDSFIDFFGVYF